MALRVFRSMYDAQTEGFEVYDRAPVVFIVRRKNLEAALGWDIAVVQLTTEPEKNPSA